MFRKVLLPLDGSSIAEEALGVAAAIARAAEAELEIVMAHESLAFGGYEDTPWSTISGEAEREYLHRLRGELENANVSVSGASVESGGPADVIRSRAQSIGADLIVMTTHGRTGLSRAWLGSVADAVLRESPVPVLMVRPSEQATPFSRTEHALFHRILVPLDGSESAGSILDSAVALARLANGKLLLLRVVAPVPQVIPDLALPYGPVGVTIPDPEATKDVVATAEDQLSTIANELAGRSGVEVEPLVVVSEATGQAVLDTAVAQKADLIAMTSHGRGMSRLLVGSVVDKVLRGGTLPLLVFRPHKRGEG